MYELCSGVWGITFPLVPLTESSLGFESHLGKQVQMQVALNTPFWGLVGEISTIPKITPREGNRGNLEGAWSSLF